MDNKLIFLSFADKRFNSKRIKDEALSANCFDKVIVENEDNFENWYKERFKDRFKDRGFGYWQWKSYRIRRLLEQIDENDVLVYLDAGCHLNCVGGKWLKDSLLWYIKSCPVALFQSNASECSYTKGDIYSYFSTLGYDTTFKNQLQGGVIILRKTFETTQLIDNWYYICHNHYSLIDDSQSISSNHESFIENRHDQAVLSILANNYPCTYWPISEIYTAGDWNNLIDKPIWIVRDKQENVPFLKMLKRKIKRIIKWENR